MAALLKKVVLVGAGGNLGSHVLRALANSNKFDVTILTREVSTSTFPDEIRVIRSDYTPSSLESAFRGQDAVVSVVGREGSGEQGKLIDAALAAGVKRFIPSEFGNNSADGRVRALAPVLEAKKAKIDFLRRHEDKISWTVIIPGAFFDLCLKAGFLGFSLDERRATIYDQGVVPFSTSTLSQIARSVVSVLEHADITANQYVYVESFTVTQNQVLESLETLTGEKWRVQHVDFKPLVEDAKDRFRRGDLSGTRYLNLSAGLAKWEDGPYGDWSVLPGGSWNEKLKLPKENLDEIVKSLL